MSFNTNSGEIIFGIFAIGASFSMSINAIIDAINGAYGSANTHVLISGIILLFGAVFFFADYSKKDNPKTDNKLPLYLLVLSALILTIAGLLSSV